MVMDNLGEIIAEFMTIPRALRSLDESVFPSAILDTSNYTVRAISLGKDAPSYQYHAHSSDLSAAISSDGILRVVSYGDVTLSSYQTSAFYAKTNNKLLPEFSKPDMNRLEERSTQVNYLPSSLDLGQNLNFIPSGGASACLGCYAPDKNFKVHILSAVVGAGQPLTDNLIVSAQFNNNTGFNAKNTIDSRGFILMDVPDIYEGRDRELSENYGGLIMSHTTEWATPTGDLNIRYILNIDSNDFICLNIFGGIYNMGLWCYDLKAMADKGIYPPFSEHDKEDLEYKLVARKTFTQDLTTYKDSGTSPGILNLRDLKLIWSWGFR
jgi:hypothetical protein